MSASSAAGEDQINVPASRRDADISSTPEALEGHGGASVSRWTRFSGLISKTAGATIKISGHVFTIMVRDDS